MAEINYPILINLVDDEGVKDLSINRYKVLHPLNGEGYSIEYLNPKIHQNGLGGVVSRMLAAIHDELLHEKPQQLTEYDQVILVVRAHRIQEYHDYSMNVGARTGEFSLVTDNYKKLIIPPLDLGRMRDKVLSLLFRFFNERFSDTITALSIYSSLNYSLPAIRKALDFLAKTNKIEVSIVEPDSYYLNEYNLSPAVFDDLEKKFRNEGIPMQFEGDEIPTKGYDFFICHASEDKEIFVEELASRFIKENINVWYDQFSLKWGDRLRPAIEKGLRESRFGIVVLSHNFFKKDWPQNELDALFVLEGSSKKILPIWLGINYEDVKKYSLMLAGRYALKASDGLDVIIEKAKELISN